MQNGKIVELLDLGAKLMELHDGDPYRVRTYNSAAYNLDKYNERPLREMTEAELLKLPGVGKSIAAKILEIADTGSFAELDQLLESTPEGVIGMFRIKGLGVKRIRTLWRELGIESVFELEQACKSGKIAAVKGFGAGTQQTILESIEFVNSQRGKLRMNEAAYYSGMLQEALRSLFSAAEVSGEVRLGREVVDRLEFIVVPESFSEAHEKINRIAGLENNLKESGPMSWRGVHTDSGVLVEIRFVVQEKLVSECFINSCHPDHLLQRTTSGNTLFHFVKHRSFEYESDIYKEAGLPFIVQEMREGQTEWEWSRHHQPDELVTRESLKGVLHNHSTYSDGRNTLTEMADHCITMGFEYLGIADHSQSAGYANGLNAFRVLEQHREIDELNAAYANAGKQFRILKGIESDILSDGSLDYPDEVLAGFDFIVASIHSNLTMTLEKAMHRILTAVANPYTTILGHPTGRLLLERAGYPVDHRAIIDACAEQNVVIEINANPWRLDLDWRWINYCMEKGVMLSINPDAHEAVAYSDMWYGVTTGRKGGLTRSQTLNTLSLDEIQNWLKNQRDRKQRKRNNP